TNTSRNADANDSAAAAATTTTTAAAGQHLWRARQSLGLQLLHRQRDLRPALNVLQLFQLHSILLDQHQRLRRGMRRCDL
ncbi:MAG TPA: hypothetical protein VEQ12_00800, partial [Candidatus Limnocylindria bacterium]|nr:hypothetical protein [Candidatus Limnocylindria bacterium]